MVTSPTLTVNTQAWTAWTAGWNYGGSGVVPFFTTCSTQWDAIVSPIFQQICVGFWWPFLPLQTAENHSQFNNKNLSNMCRILVAISASLCLPLVSKLRKIILHRISSINSYLYNYGPKKCQDYGNLVCNAY